MTVKNNYKNWKGEPVTNCEKGEGHCNKPSHYTTKQHEAALKRNQTLLGKLPEGLTVEEIDSDNDGYISYEDYQNALPVIPALEGFSSTGKTLTPASIPTNSNFKEYINQAVEEGYSIYEGPWGNREGDSSVVLEKYYPELEGKITITVADRDDKNIEGSTAYKNHGPVSKIRHTSAWFVSDVQEGYAHPQHSLNTDQKATAFNSQELLAAAGTCDGCHKNVGRKNLNHVAFSNNFCSECTPEARERLEYKGWYN